MLVSKFSLEYVHEKATDVASLGQIDAPYKALERKVSLISHFSKQIKTCAPM